MKKNKKPEINGVLSSKVNPLEYEKMQIMDFSLRDFQKAVISGNLNSLQVLNPLEIIYSLEGSSEKYRARVNYKNDPRVLLAEESKSIFLGSERKNIYLANPTCAFFTLEEENGQGRRMMAESILTIDQDINQNIKHLIATREAIENILPDNVLDCDAKRFLSCDSINVLPDMRKKINLVKIIYKDFFNKYIAYQNKNASSFLLESSELIIGPISANVHFGKKRKNTYLPVSLIGYSEKQGPFVDVLDLVADNEIKIISEDEVNENISDGKEITKMIGKIQPLLSTDMLAIPVIEKKAYPEDMHEGMAELQNYIFASAINNRIRNFPDLSMKYVDAEGNMAGYFISYQGIRKGIPVVYIENIAVDPKNKIAGSRIINSFLQKYQEEYMAKNNLLPIYIQAREETTYFMLFRRFDRLREKYGVDLEVEEVNKYKYGRSTMHSLLITPRRI